LFQYNPPTHYAIYQSHKIRRPTGHTHTRYTHGTSRTTSVTQHRQDTCVSAVCYTFACVRHLTVPDARAHTAVPAYVGEAHVGTAHVGRATRRRQRRSQPRPRRRTQRRLRQCLRCRVPTRRGARSTRARTVPPFCSADGQTTALCLSPQSLGLRGVSS